jgi:hypothetical protein
MVRAQRLKSGEASSSASIRHATAPSEGAGNVYQQATVERDKAIASALDVMIASAGH